MNNFKIHPKFLNLKEVQIQQDTTSPTQPNTQTHPPKTKTHTSGVRYSNTVEHIVVVVRQGPKKKKKKYYECMRVRRKGAQCVVEGVTYQNSSLSLSLSLSTNSQKIQKKLLLLCFSTIIMYSNISTTTFNATQLHNH